MGMPRPSRKCSSDSTSSAGVKEGGVSKGWGERSDGVSEEEVIDGVNVRGE